MAKDNNFLGKLKLLRQRQAHSWWRKKLKDKIPQGAKDTIKVKVEEAEECIALTNSHCRNLRVNFTSPAQSIRWLSFDRNSLE